MCRNDKKQPARRLLSTLVFAAAVAYTHTAQTAPAQTLRASDEAQELMDLAKRYEHGVGAPQDTDRAIQLYCDAARQGHAEAQYHLGWIYATGRAGKVDEILAAAWFKEAVTREHRLAAQRIRALGANRIELNQGADCVLRAAMVSRRIDAAAGLASSVKQRSPVVAEGELNTHDIKVLVRKLAPDFGLDPELVLAVVTAESNFDPAAVSPKNAQGLMQLIPGTANRFGVQNVWDPVDNLRGGMAYLRWLLNYFNGDLHLALAGYNAGENAVDRHGGIPPYPETQNYVKRITKMLDAKPGAASSPLPAPAGGRRTGGDAVPSADTTLADQSRS